MAFFDWVTQVGELSDGALTVRAQQISPNDDGNLIWDLFFPRENANSVVVTTLTTSQVRYVADRREWNARGRQIPFETPEAEEITLVPVESWFRLGEREIQDLEERTDGNEALMRSIMGPEIPTRTDSLVAANYRRVEMDAMTSWALGTLTARNPSTGNTATFSFGFDAARYTTASPAWTGGSGGTAYTKFVDWLNAGVDYLGGAPIGVVLRKSTREAIRTSAPNLAFPISTTIPAILRDVERRIEDEIGGPFRFVTMERTVDPFPDAGIVPTKLTKLWPAMTIAAIPPQEQVGVTKFAPVARAYQIRRREPNAQIDVRGQTVFSEVENAGREYVQEAQINPLTVPDENRLWVTNAGI